MALKTKKPPGKRPNAERFTPVYEDWLDGLRRQLSPRGAIQPLASFMAKTHGGSSASWRVRIARLFDASRLYIATGPQVCAINEWLQGQKP